ncbi:MAG: hypothetical protein ACKPEY_20325 [Planctomycetota bacterium]
MFTTLPHAQLEASAGARPRPSRSPLCATTFHRRFSLSDDASTEQTWPQPLDNRVAYDGMVTLESVHTDSSVAFSLPKFRDHSLHPEGMSCERP